mmetsp:Transcript_404/g.544  ORF Transcript_404/g.544 Transcript_404/m.544 type:complete len:217 (+) Transcript_404:73-723(+)|eukprot:CAMPEP_0197026858 /NCGR_PEP_ID=MMETSP1384-20130603/6870_1 /TAXON_ID=29189 /ORGANISM="Ammonia sp." /LENGTH=216 /DNA_ID=CAMNT_0042455609 /DNA_START=64 /DNA_END=714 /DNA_ORIENTATION=-
MTARQPYDIKLKVLMIGDSGVGKSCLVLRFGKNQFTSSFMTTIGIDFQIKTIEIDGKRVKLLLWDTAGQERFHTITNAYYRGAHGVLLVYDVTDTNSFGNVTTWMNNIHQHADESISKILVANKCDMVHDRVVSVESGKALARDYNVPYFETSAKNDINVHEVFVAIAKDIIQRKFTDDDLELMAGNKKSAKNKRVKLHENGNRAPNGRNCACQLL